jgi:hypothetical protein
MAKLHKIFEPWEGNAEAMAIDIGELGVTVRQWRARGRIRDVYWRKIISAAARRGFALTADDFLADVSIGDHAASVTAEAAAGSFGKTDDVSASAAQVSV